MAEWRRSDVAFGSASFGHHRGFVVFANVEQSDIVERFLFFDFDVFGRFVDFLQVLDDGFGGFETPIAG